MVPSVSQAAPSFLRYLETTAETKVLTMSEKPTLEPYVQYAISGLFGNRAGIQVAEEDLFALFFLLEQCGLGNNAYSMTHGRLHSNDFHFKLVNSNCCTYTGSGCYYTFNATDFLQSPTTFSEAVDHAMFALHDYVDALDGFKRIRHAAGLYFLREEPLSYADALRQVGATEEDGAAASELLELINLDGFVSAGAVTYSESAVRELAKAALAVVRKHDCNMLAGPRDSCAVNRLKKAAIAVIARTGEDAGD